MDRTLDDKTREAVALKKFSLIGPVLNGLVKNQNEYFRKLSNKVIQMPYYGPKQYSFKTFKGWVYDYRRGGIDALKPGYRKDRGSSRKVSGALSSVICKRIKENERMPLKLIYEKMVEDDEINPEKVSLSTFYRHVTELQKNMPSGSGQNDKEPERILRYSFEKINACWQIDIMYGPYIHYGKSKRQTYLVGIIDDASRLIVHSAFYHNQKYESLRHCLKEAVSRRGIPGIVYTDNGKIFRSQQFEYLCAEIGSSLIHSQPMVPRGRGKIERYFRTVRTRFLSRINSIKLKHVDELNEKYFYWLEHDYQNKKHSSLGISPLDFFLKQADDIRLPSNPQWLEEAFLIRKKRTVNHDATIQIENILYETQPHLKGMRVEIRYEPEWLLGSDKPVLIYVDGKKAGDARRVDFISNVYVKRSKSIKKHVDASEGEADCNDEELSKEEYTQSISFTSMMEGSEK